MGKIKNVIKHIVRKKLPYRVRPNLPSATFESIQLVLSYCLAAKPNATFIQVGACDGTTDDAVHGILKGNTLRSVLLEPMPENFASLQNAYAGSEHVQLMNAAVGYETGQMAMYHVRDEGRWKGSPASKQWASFDRSHLTKHGVKDSEIDETKVEVVTLDDVCKRNNFAELDILQIDTEGFDAEIVRMALKSSYEPTFIYFEYIHIIKDMKSLLADLGAHGYKFTYDKWNVLAVKDNLTG